MEVYVIIVTMSRSVPKAAKPKLKIREISPEPVLLYRFNESIQPEFSFDDVMIHNDIFSGNESLHGDALLDVLSVHESSSAVPRLSVSELGKFIDKCSYMNSCRGLQTDLSPATALVRLPAVRQPIPYNFEVSQPSSIVSSIRSVANSVRTGVVI